MFSMQLVREEDCSADNVSTLSTMNSPNKMAFLSSFYALKTDWLIVKVHLSFIPTGSYSQFPQTSSLSLSTLPNTGFQTASLSLCTLFFWYTKEYV